MSRREQTAKYSEREGKRSEVKILILYWLSQERRQKGKTFAQCKSRVSWEDTLGRKS